MSRKYLNFEPEPIESMQARYVHAITDFVDVSTVLDALAGSKSVDELDSPASHRKHVFDFENGIRLCISVDGAAALTSGRFLHVSGNNQLKQVEEEELKKQVLEHFKKVSNHIGNPLLIRASDVSVHIFYRLSAA